MKLGTQYQLQISRSQSAPNLVQYLFSVIFVVQIYGTIFSVSFESRFKTAKIVALLGPQIKETNILPKVKYAIIMFGEATWHVSLKLKLKLRLTLKTKHTPQNVKHDIMSTQLIHVKCPKPQLTQLQSVTIALSANASKKIQMTKWLHALKVKRFIWNPEILLFR